ncbi:hypothetical protein Cgig2_029419 [Carnegiea gigantea]|uniref:Uncharacterized protein n=1 Tax=Carnegiea gigantea TaxID=171969 RepID=A0A9Q1GX69_9CARY|nr:hypothetical protein Cgig2_029419 [Carnegiea gigantea]
MEADVTLLANPIRPAPTPTKMPSNSEWEVTAVLKCPLLNQNFVLNFDKEVKSYSKYSSSSFALAIVEALLMFEKEFIDGASHNYKEVGSSSCERSFEGVFPSMSFHPTYYFDPSNDSSIFMPMTIPPVFHQLCTELKKGSRSRNKKKSNCKTARAILLELDHSHFEVSSGQHRGHKSDSENYGAVSGNSTERMETPEQFLYTSPLVNGSENRSFQSPYYVDTDYVPPAQDWFGDFNISANFPNQGLFDGANYDLMLTTGPTINNVKETVDNSQVSHSCLENEMILDARLGDANITASEVPAVEMKNEKGNALLKGFGRNASQSSEEASLRYFSFGSDSDARSFLAPSEAQHIGVYDGSSVYLHIHAIDRKPIDQLKDLCQAKSEATLPDGYMVVALLRHQAHVPQKQYLHHIEYLDHQHFWA